MYQANPHSANDKYSALDNIQMGGNNNMNAFSPNTQAPSGGFDVFGNNNQSS